MSHTAADVQRWTVEAFGPTWLAQAIANLPTIARRTQADSYAGRFDPDVPVFLVGAGPSLAKNAKHLRWIGGKALVIACSHALPCLLARDVVPDVVIVTDAQDLSSHFRDLDHRSMWDLAVCVGASCHPAVVRIASMCGSGMVTFPANGPYDEWAYEPFGGHRRVASGGSVLCSAASLATMWGARKLVLVGNDLAFDDEFVPHCDAAPLVHEGETFSEAAVLDAPEQVHQREMLPGVRGNPVWTSPSLRTVHEWWQTTVPTMARDGVRVINATEGGAEIAGTELMPLEEAVALARERREPVRWRLDWPPRDRSDRLERMRAFVVDMIRECDHVVDLASDCAQAAYRRAEPTEMRTKEQTLRDVARHVALLSAVGAPAISAQIAAAAKEVVTHEDACRVAFANYGLLAATARSVRPLLKALDIGRE